MAMDYEFRILLAERELAHLKEMQALQRAHLDTHDRSFEAAGERLNRIESLLEQTAQSQVRTQKMLEDFVAILARSHGNGGPKEPPQQ
jgi:hypothetical protein